MCIIASSLRGGSPCADVVELVDTLDSKSGFFGSDGSSPSIGTIQGIYMHLAFKVVIPVVIYQTPVVITLPLSTEYTYLSSTYLSTQEIQNPILSLSPPVLTAITIPYKPCSAYMYA